MATRGTDVSAELAECGTIAPAALLERLAAGAAVTILDVREDPSWPIEAPAARVVWRPAAEVLRDPAAASAELGGPAVVVCARGRTARGVAEVLHPAGQPMAVLEGGMRGWIGALHAAEVPAGLEGARLVQVQRPGRGCLSYLLAAGDEALVVDPAPDAAFYLALAADAGARVTGVFDTHLHADHLSGARELAARSGAKLMMPAASLARGVSYAERVEPVEDGTVLAAGGVELRALALPGHTTDMTGLLIARSALLSGDSLFADGIARPDLQRGDPEGAHAMARTLHATIRERILALGPDVLLLGGHAHPGVLSGPLAPRLGELAERVPELALEDPDEFAEALLRDMPPRPENYETVIVVNSGRAPFDPELEVGGNSCSTSS